MQYIIIQKLLHLLPQNRFFMIYFADTAVFLYEQKYIYFKFRTYSKKQI